MNKNGNMDTFFYVDVPVFIAAIAIWSFFSKMEAISKLGLSFAERWAVWGDIGTGNQVAMVIMVIISGALGLLGGFKLSKLIDEWGI